MGKKFVYLFSEGKDSMRNTLGGKGANLSGMRRMGLPVPNGFTVSTDACVRYYKDGKVISQDIVKEIFKTLKKVENETGKKLGDGQNPLLLSVRSGARVSMPGMMNTVLNLGLNDEVVEGLANLTNNARFAYDSYRRFIMMFADVVKGVDRLKFEKALSDMKELKGRATDQDLTAEDLKAITKQFKAIYKKELKTEFPQDPKEQLLSAVAAVFNSWETERAIVYRRLHNIPSSWGTAVNVQMMVFGNMGNDSGSGVAFTRNPATGEKTLYGEFLTNAQGEDVVAGIRTPERIEAIKQINPALYDEFVAICNRLEHHYKDMQDMEFTIERGKLYMLQTRNGKRTATAGLKIAIDLVNEGMLTKKQALLKIDPNILDTLLHPTFDEGKLKNTKEIASGLAASPGAASGVIALTPAKAKALKEKGIESILVREETTPDDIEGMLASNGVLTANGGMTSHAAVVARGLGTACVVGCASVHINETSGEVRVGKQVLKEGDSISIDGGSGKVYLGVLDTVEAQITNDFKTIMDWSDEIATLEVRANADNERDALRALELGARGIGLCRTEHMFFAKERVKAVREMILAENETERKKALAKVLPMQRKDFFNIFKVLKNLPVTIRFLDMPLHEFLPKQSHEIAELAKTMKVEVEKLERAVAELTEQNPMMGFRGCRLSIVMPEIARMQTQAVIEAAIDVKKKHGTEPHVEIMIPLVGHINELRNMKDVVIKTADELILASGVNIYYTVGTMIEVPRACIIADKLAKEAEFFSFGTNDLTQMTYGFSRDDAGKFLNHYYDKNILEFDPFVRIDEDGVGYLINRTVKLARSAKKNLKCGICGEHGGNPESVAFANRVGLDYVSCSPYRVPIARLSAAQAKITQGRAKK